MIGKESEKHMTKYLIGAVGALLGALGGGWLMVAPFVLAYQPEGADWADPTFVDFWTGLPLVVISVVGFAAFVRALIKELGDRGILERRVPAGYPQAQGYAQQGGAVEQTIAPLLTEMLKDMQEQRRLEGGESSQRRSGESTSPGTDRQTEPERRT